ncbi:MAG TPA: hypothetical protein VML75_23475 [Kofleriaceae bacterium]|nr:hypothetical protein [Kofleriaceae bacterium]
MWRRGYRTALACAIGLGFSGAARADDRPVVAALESSDAVPTGELVAALRTQLSAVAWVEIGPSVPTGSLGDRFALASSVVDRGNAVLVVWIERTGGGDAGHDEYIVYAVGSDPSRALVEVVRIAADEGPGTVRVMALKVANMVDLVLSSSGTSGEVARAFAGSSVARTRAQPSGRYAVRIAAGMAGAAFGGDLPPRAGAQVSVGVAREDGQVVLSGHADARWMTGARAHNDAGAINVGEIALAIRLSAGLLVLGHGRIGADLHGGVRLHDADARALDGRTDSATSVIPVMGVGVHGEIDLRGRLSLHAHVGGELTGYRQRFLILHQPVADLGRFRAVGVLSLIWTWR